MLLQVMDGDIFEHSPNLRDRLTAVPESRFSGYGRVVQFAKFLLFSSLSGGWGSQLALSQGASTMLKEHLENPSLDQETRDAIQCAYDGLVSSDPRKAWTSGIWVTELPSGSDFTGLTTAEFQADNDGKRLGELKLGHWALYGSKFYASGPDATVTLILANTAKGPSAFLAPLRIPVQDQSGRAIYVPNGISIRCLKKKCGSTPVAVAEVELSGMRAWLIGQEGRGAREVLTFLTVARMFACAGTLSAWGHSLRVARAFAKVRRIGRKPLNELPLHMHSLAKSHLAYKARLMLLLYLSGLLQLNEQKHSGDETLPFCVGLDATAEDVELLFRWLVPAAKAFLGGLGYMENEEGEFNIARLYRDMSAGPIVEGTSNVLAAYAMNLIEGNNGSTTLAVIDTAVFAHIECHQNLALERKLILESWSRLKLVLSDGSIEHIGAAESFARHIIDHICAALLITDAGRDGDEVACEFAKRWGLQVCGATEHYYKKVETPGKLLLDQRLCYGSSYQH
ncbi:hypothetical protein M431DRAFT_479817 [Trichoderma harzianum CBS 226.95]|uniref:Acyl-CoA dehydrogenase/oxidase C-terminal domain-containing protein n=1 Tax=Trichoderma harzianum CBS 226.95 TaxID=983964 RepID=A0A2T4AMM6_TRIHA|nr:hypothetical protein M431DRAFT_479817 [Trichoderma harzianum CBS 226.95]PTB58329.1 hypothetical protein M431DRAFT_479817 [Trichoderma harzianum CBS 226.95]